MWVAVAAMAVVSLARVQAGIENPSAYTNPVLEFLAGHQNASGLSATSAPHVVNLGTARKASAVFLHDAAPGAWVAFLPILFVGLVAPLSLISPQSFQSLRRTTAAPAFPFSFQRPPPMRG